MSQKIPKEPFAFGLYTSKPHRKWLISALLFVVFATALDRVTVVILRYLTDAIASQPINFHDVWFWAISYPSLFFIAETFFWRSSGFTGMRWFMNMRFTAYESLYSYLTLHSKDYFSSRFSGALTNKIGNAVDGTEVLYESILWRFLPLLLGIIWYIIFAWMSSPWLGFFIWAWSVLFFAINVWFAKKLTPRSFEFAQSLSLLKGKLVDSLSNISLVHEYAYVTGERTYINQFIQKQRDTGLARWQLSEWILMANGVLICLFMFAMLGISVYLLEQKAITLGVIVMVIAIVADLGNRLFFLGQEMRDAAKYYGEAKEGLAEILRSHTIIDSPHARSVTFKKGEIRLDAVSFQYENATVFQNLSLHIPAGQKVGLVGRSGAGKTTFVSLLLRHFDIQEGNVQIDGENIYEVKLESLRRAIAFVPQDTSLFHRTIRENIKYSNPRATMADIEHASKLAQSHEFISKLPKAYDTLVGERGVKLSGGQRQRIAIARAFLKNAPILILDEATSSLDSESEHAIQESLEKLMKDKTVIAIAHRLSTLKKMDRILVLADGKIVEDGSPDNLMKRKNGLFKSMWEHQIKGFIVDE